MKLSSEELEFMKFVEGVTRARVKDCIMHDEDILVVVDSGDMGQVIGKKGENINRVRKSVGKDVSVVEFSDDLGTFLKRLFTQNTVENWTKQGDAVQVRLTKRIGVHSRKMQHAKELLLRYYSINNINLE